MIISRRIWLGASVLLLAGAPAFAWQAMPVPVPAAVPAADETARTVEAIAGIRASFSPSLSPDTRHMAFISNESGIPQVWTMSLDGSGPAARITDLADPVQSVHWSPAGDLLAYEVAPGGGLNVQIYVMRPDGSGARRLTAGGHENNRLDGWTADGKLLRIASNEVHPRGMDALLIDPETGEKKTVVADKGLNSITDVSRDGRYALVFRLASRGDNNLYVVELVNGRETLLTPHDPPGSFGWGQFSADGRRIYVSSNGESDLTAFGVIEFNAAGQPGPIRILAERSDAEGEGAILSRDGRRAALVWNVAGRSEMDFLDTATGEITHGPVLPVDILSGGDFSADGRVLAVVGSSANAPANIYTIDVTTGGVARRTDSRHDDVNLASFVRPELVTYTAHDGLELSGWLYRPRGASGPGPLVFNYHGGPEGQARPGMSDVTQALIARGIAVFAPNIRGSSGFGKRFVNLDNGPLRFDANRDVEATTKAMVEAGIGDPARLGIMGGSYGGYKVMVGVTDYPDMFAAAANLFGIVNFETFFQQTEPWMAAISTIEYGDPATQSELLRSLSPIHKLNQIRTPLLVLHGANDTNVPVIEAEQIVDNLRRRDIPVEYILFEDEGHGWRKLPNRVRSTVSIVNFFDRKLNQR
jgi:dipeptidyl aminopeptidase/acylaminoacyl peptidase